MEEMLELFFFDLVLSTQS